MATQKKAELDALAELEDAVLEINPCYQIAQATLPINTMEAMMDQLTVMVTSKMGGIVNKHGQDISVVKEDPKNERSSRPVSRSRSL